MPVQRLRAPLAGPPFPVYPDVEERLLDAHRSPHDDRDATVAHVLGTCAGYAYSDTDTVSEIMVRMGLEAHACVHIAQSVDAMFIFSTAYLFQSRCGRVAILCYRGTETTNLLNWLGNADVGPATRGESGDAHDAVTGRHADGISRIHAGFHRNMRATAWHVLRELDAAIDGRSIVDRTERVPHPLEALYVTGHSLGGAMALLFALAVCGDPAQAALMQRLRAVYTYGQPMAVTAPPPTMTADLEARILRHVLPRDPVPAVPPAQWGPFVHLGQAFHYIDGAWVRGEAGAAHRPGRFDMVPSLLSFLAPHKLAASLRYALKEHAPHRYIAALRPHDRVTEFGDRYTESIPGQ